MILFRSARGKEGRFDTFMSGLIGGYYVFGRGPQSSVSQQIVIYVFARVMLASAKLLIKPPGAHSTAGAPGGWGLVKEEGKRKWVQEHAWPAFASLSWAFVMYIFRWHPETVQSSLRSSMQYMCVFLPVFCVERAVANSRVLQLRGFGPLGLIRHLPLEKQIDASLGVVLISTFHSSPESIDRTKLHRRKFCMIFYARQVGFLVGYCSTSHWRRLDEVVPAALSFSHMSPSCEAGLDSVYKIRWHLQRS